VVSDYSAILSEQFRKPLGAPGVRNAWTSKSAPDRIRREKQLFVDYLVS